MPYPNRSPLSQAEVETGSAPPEVAALPLVPGRREGAWSCRAAWAEAATVVAEVKCLQEGPHLVVVCRGRCPHRATCWFRGEGHPLSGSPQAVRELSRPAGAWSWKPGRRRALFQKEVPVEKVDEAGQRGGGLWSGRVCFHKAGPIAVTPTSVD